MRKLRQFILVLSALSCLGTIVALSTTPAMAAGTNPYSGVNCSGAASKSPVCNASNKDPLTGSNGIIVKATRLVALAAGFAAVVIIIISGINLMISGGDSSKITNARNSIINASIGLVIIALAQAIITFVVSKV